jgi:hypothetical protein
MKVLFLILFIFSNACHALTYESKKYPSYSVGDILIYSEIVMEDGSMSQSTITEKLIEKATYSGSSIEKWEIIESQTTPFLKVNRIWTWRDIRGNEILEDLIDNKGEGFTGVYNTLNGQVDKSPTLGSVVVDESVIGSVTMNINGSLFGGYGIQSTKGSLSEVTSFSVGNDTIKCYKISFSIEGNVELHNAAQGKRTVQWTATGNHWHSNKYGEIKVEYTGNFSSTFQGATNTWTESTTKTLISAQISNNTPNSISSASSILGKNYNGWSWNRWPWVYNSEIQNWLYYYPSAAGQYSVYNNSDGKWYSWNVAQETWVKAN